MRKEIMIAALVVLVSLSAAATANRPNNYITVDSNGVLTELEQGADAYVPTGPVKTTDLATQSELNAQRQAIANDTTYLWQRTETNRKAIEQSNKEDHRVVGGSLNGDTLTMRSQDMDGGSKRTFDIDMSGLRGNNGANGANGADGAAGRDGTNGLNGRDGIDGTNGLNGADGIDGVDGRDGTNGLNGTNGRDGIDGIDGTNGVDGVDGIDGIDGRDGADGRDGIDGTNGRDGRDGIDGRDGKDVDPKTADRLSSGMAATIAAAHAIRTTDGVRLGVGYYSGKTAVAVGARHGSKTFTFTFDESKRVSVGFGVDL